MEVVGTKVQTHQNPNFILHSIVSSNLLHSFFFFLISLNIRLTNWIFLSICHMQLLAQSKKCYCGVGMTMRHASCDLVLPNMRVAQFELMVNSTKKKTPHFANCVLIILLTLIALYVCFV